MKITPVLLLSFSLTGITASAQRHELSAKELKSMAVEDLLNVEVTLVSRSPQKLSEAASAVQVITGSDIRNSGATNIAEALRLVSNLQVAQMQSHVWLIGSRGFNTLFANKLLVMIDGRTVYTPLFAGVFWDIQNVLLEDVERIEVVSGPGGSLWGANAVNGIINIITKSAADTKGVYASVLGGSFVRDHVAARWGGKIGNKINFRIHGQHYDRNATKLPDGSKHTDAWRVSQGGFRMDWTGGKTDNDNYTVQGDYYGGTIKSTGRNSDFDAQNILARWKRNLGNNSDMTLQLYYDRYFKSDRPGKTSDELNTVDLDFEYRLPIKKYHNILLGAGYRRVRDNFISDTPSLALLPQKKNLDLATAFIQDEIKLSQSFSLTLGTKLLHNVYTGLEVQPGVRIAVTVNSKNSLWAAVSRAVRTPSRLDVDYFAPATRQPPSVPSVAGGPDFASEKLIAYELGYRTQPTVKSNISIATFYNSYKDIYSLELLPGTFTYQIQNGSEAKSWGAELSASYQLTSKWQLKGGYTYFDMDLKAKEGHDYDPSYLANDVRNQVFLHSMSDLPWNFHIDVIARYLDYLPATIATPKVPSYFTFDTRLAYSIKFAELSLVGQNLFQKKHSEFSALSIPRSVYAKLSVRL